jgi:mannose-6-phosphate isomerase-like protein (cupin superfamily)
MEDISRLSTHATSARLAKRKDFKRMPSNSKSPMVSTIETSKITPFLGVDYSVLLPRERSECVEILLERFPKGLAFPIHQHKECEQTYLFLEGEGEVTLAGEIHRVTKGGVVYIPRLTDHAVRNVGDSELVYVVVETYPDGYLPDEPTWDSHIEALQKHYDARK